MEASTPRQDQQIIRWGILGMGNIAQRFMASLKHSSQGQLLAAA